MMWYYADSGKRAGPVSDEDLEALRQQGKVTDETLVWREGMANWQSIREARTGSAARGALPGETGEAGGEIAAVDAVAEGAAEVICSECGRRFPHDDVIRYGDVWVCAACKPAFVQKLKEGLRVGGGLDYAGFWNRFCAVFVDGILLQAISIPMLFGLGLSFAQIAGVDRESQRGVVLILTYVLPTLIGMVYEVLLVGRYGATLGKMACKIKVVTPDGGPISYGRAFGRYWAKYLSSLILCIGYIMAAFDPEKRALHDHMCSTRVIRTR